MIDSWLVCLVTFVIIFIESYFRAVMMVRRDITTINMIKFFYMRSYNLDSGIGLQLYKRRTSYKLLIFTQMCICVTYFFLFWDDCSKVVIND